MYHSFWIHSFTDGHLGCFQHLAIVNLTWQFHCWDYTLRTKIFWSHQLPAPTTSYSPISLFPFIAKLSKRLVCFCLLQFLSLCLCFDPSNFSSPSAPLFHQNCFYQLPNPMNSYFSSYLIYQQLLIILSSKNIFFPVFKSQTCLSRPAPLSFALWPLGSWAPPQASPNLLNFNHLFTWTSAHRQPDSSNSLPATPCSHHYSFTWLPWLPSPTVLHSPPSP